MKDGARGGEGLAARMAAKAAEAVSGGFLQGSQIALRRDENGLWLQAPGLDHPVLITSVRPAFPLSMGPEMLVFSRRRDPDPTGSTNDRHPAEEEIGILRSLSELSPKGQDLLAGEIEKAYFVPRIRRILSIEETFGIQRWEVITDRGARSFELTERSNLRPFDNSRLVIKDVDGNRYLVEDARLLDRRSQQWLDLQL